MSNILLFCRIVLAITFLIAFLTKFPNIDAFRQTISNFKLLPSLMHLPLTVILLMAEITIFLLLIIGGRTLNLGFAFSILILLLFTFVLIVVLKRQIRASCNCFGITETPISVLHIFRNFLLLVFATTGLILSSLVLPNEPNSVVETFSISTLAIITVLIITNLDDMVSLFR